MKHSEFSIHRLFLYQGREYICTDIGQRTIIAVLFSDVREDWWLCSTPYPGAMSEAVFDENRLPACEPVSKPGVPPPARTSEKPAAPASTPSPAPPVPPPLRLLVLATIFCVFGVGSLIYCASSSLYTRAFLARAARAVATVASVEESTGQRGSRRYTPTLTFVDGKGKTWTNDTGQTEDAPRRIGEEVAVLYDPQNPAEARIESFEHTWGTPLTSGLVSLLMLGIGASMGKDFSRKLREANGGQR